MGKLGPSLLEAVFETVSDGIVAADEEGRIRLYNAAAERIFGYPPGEVVGRDVDCLMPSPGGDRHHQFLQNYLRTGESHIIGVGREVCGQRKDGSTFPMELAVSEASVEGERYFVGVIRDISRRKRDEETLRRERDFTTSVLETVGSLILVLDADARIVRFNQACEQMTGYRAREIVGRPVWDVLLLAEEVPNIRKVFGELTAGFFPNRYRNTWLTRAGERRIIDWRNTALVDDRGTVVNVVATGIDVTEHIESEQRLQKLQSELSHVSRLSEMGQMASALSHEVSQPLTAATNYLGAGRRMLAGDGESPVAKVAAIVDKAAEQVDRAAEIVRRLRQFVKTGQGEQQPENLPRVIEEASTLALIGSKERGIAFQSAAAPDIPPVWIDKIQIQQVLVNLIRNAIEAMEQSEIRELRIEAAFGGGAQVEVSVIDTGSGIAPEIAERLFQPFVTSKSEGMGVGLSICRTIVESHGGKLWTEPNPAGGAIFRFTVPIAPGIGL